MVAYDGRGSDDTLFEFGLAVRVGHNPDAVPPVGSANGGSGNTVPFCVKPDRSEAPEHLVQSARSKGRNVFNDREFRAGFGDDPEHFEPEAGAISAESGAATSNADVLARKAAAHNINGNSICRESVGCDFADIIVTGDSGPMLCQYLAGIRLDLAERDRPKSPSRFESKAEPANTGEKV